MFWAAGRLIKDNIDPVTMTLTINPNDVFTALFAIMFGASHLGYATAFGPDMGKAMAAAKRIFKIKDYPSEIDAIQIDED